MNNYNFLNVYDCNNKLRIGSEYDRGYIIIDNLCNNANKNFSWQHGKDRLKIYEKENFNFKTYEIEI